MRQFMKVQAKLKEERNINLLDLTVSLTEAIIYE